MTTRELLGKAASTRAVEASQNTADRGADAAAFLDALSPVSKDIVLALSNTLGWPGKHTWVPYSVIALSTNDQDLLYPTMAIGKEKKEPLLRSLAADTERLGDFVTAERAYRTLGESKRCVALATKILKSGRAEDAFSAFEAAQHVPGMLAAYRGIAAEYEGQPSERANVILDGYRNRSIPRSDRELFLSGFVDFAARLGMPEAPHFNLAGTIEMVQGLKASYDLIIGNARGGLWTAYCMKNAGADTRLVQTVSNGEERVLNLIDPIPPELVAGRRVLITDKDLVSGRSAELIVAHLRSMKPASIGLALNHGPHGEYVRSMIENAPSGIEVHYPCHRPEIWEQAFRQFHEANTRDRSGN